MKDKALVFFAAALAAMLLVPGLASAGDFTVGPQIGTLGVGLNAGWQYSDYLKFRGNTNYLPYSRSGEIEGVDYKVNLDYFTIGALADVHPFAGNFRLSGGLYYVDLSVKGKAELGNESITLGGQTYQRGDLGSGEFKGSVKWQTLAPYAGLGYGSGSGNEPGLGFSFDLGALYIGKAKVNLEAPASAYAEASKRGYTNLQENIDKEKEDVKHYTDKLQFWPVISLGVIYRF